MRCKCFLELTILPAHQLVKYASAPNMLLFHLLIPNCQFLKHFFVKDQAKLPMVSPESYHALQSLSTITSTRRYNKISDISNLLLRANFRHNAASTRGFEVKEKPQRKRRLSACYCYAYLFSPQHISHFI